MKIRYRLDAIADFAQIHSHIAEDNPAAARLIIGRIEHSITRLTRFPESGRIGVVTGTRELVVPGLPYIVVYLIVEKFIDFVAVVHAAQDWTKDTP